MVARFDSGAAKTPKFILRVVEVRQMARNLVHSLRYYLSDFTCVQNLPVGDACTSAY